MGTTVEVPSPGGGGSGDVSGPSSATDNALARFDGATGKLLQNSVVILDDSGNVVGFGTIDSSGVVTATVANNAPAFVINNAGFKMTLQCFAGIRLELVTSGPFLQFADNGDGFAAILARASKSLLLACDGTNATKGVVVQGSDGQTAKLLDVQLHDGTEVFSVDPVGNTAVNTTTGAFSPPSMTTGQRDLLTAVNGMMIYNTTVDKLQGYVGGVWTNFGLIV